MHSNTACLLACYTPSTYVSMHFKHTSAAIDWHCDHKKGPFQCHHFFGCQRCLSFLLIKHTHWVNSWTGRYTMTADIHVNRGFFETVRPFWESDQILAGWSASLAARSLWPYEFSAKMHMLKQARRRMARGVRGLRQTQQRWPDSELMNTFWEGGISGHRCTKNLHVWATNLFIWWAKNG